LTPPRSDRGEGAIGSVVGVVVFLSTLLLVVQLLAGLYAATTVEAATYDAARILAEGGGETAARAHVGNLLGEGAAMSTSRTDTTVTVEVSVAGPDLIGVPHPFRTITRRMSLRIEQPVTDP
jgi:hypothetical protein